MRFLLAVIAILVALGAFLAQRHRPREVSAPAPVGVSSRPATAVDDGSEPDEASLRRLVTEEYEAIEKAGGLPVMLTANGQKMVIHMRVETARKESCHRIPGVPGSWECSLDLMVTTGDGKPPTAHGQRIDVKRGPKGDWVSG